MPSTMYKDWDRKWCNCLQRKGKAMVSLLLAELSFCPRERIPCSYLWCSFFWGRMSWEIKLLIFCWAKHCPRGLCWALGLLHIRRVQGSLFSGVWHCFCRNTAVFLGKHLFWAGNLDGEENYLCENTVGHIDHVEDKGCKILNTNSFWSVWLYVS